MYLLLEKIIAKPLWEHLKHTEKPIVLYGMGNGADMIISILQKLGIEFKEIFASDEFVRGHYFHGKKVLKLSEVEERYNDFIILMTFAVHDETTLQKVRELSEKYEFYSPTVPIVGDELFTLEFIKHHEEEFDLAYSLLADEKSKSDFVDILNFKVSGDVRYLFGCHYNKMRLYEEILPLCNNEVIVDLGAYDGDTIREFLAVTNGSYKKIYAFEPDSKNFRKLERKTEHLINIERYNLGAWDKEETLFFSKEGSRNSKQKDGGIPVQFNSVDNIVSGKVTFIKMDIEGAELMALKGAEQTIKAYKPKLYVCAYHRNEDFFTLPVKIKELCSDYQIYFRAHPYIPAWETNFYAVIK